MDTADVAFGKLPRQSTILFSSSYVHCDSIPHSFTDCHMDADPANADSLAHRQYYVHPRATWLSKTS